MVTYHFRHLYDTFDFGKYKGMTLEDVLVSNDSYVHWCFNHIEDFTISIDLFHDIKEMFPDFIFFAHYGNRITFDYHDADMDKNIEEFDDVDNGIDEKPTYGRYAGSWAQDEMGYSDEDIDIVFDGDPEAYWNID